MKDGWTKRNPGLKWPFYGACILVGVVVLALVFGPDSTMQLVRDVLESAGLISPDIIQPEALPWDTSFSSSSPWRWGRAP